MSEDPPVHSRPPSPDEPLSSFILTERGSALGFSRVSLSPPAERSPTPEASDTPQRRGSLQIVTSSANMTEDPPVHSRPASPDEPWSSFIVTERGGALGFPTLEMIEERSFRDAEGTSRAADDKGELRSGKGEKSFKMREKTTTPFFVLVSIDGEILPGYDASTVARLGMGVGGGLHVSVCVTAGQFAQPGIHFSFMVRHGNDLDQFHDIVVPVSALLSDISVHKCRAEDLTALAALTTFRHRDMSTLSQCRRKDKFSDDLAGADFSNPVALLPRVSSMVNYFRLEVDLLQTFQIPNVEFFKIAEDRPPAARQIVSEVLSRLRSSPKAALTVYFFAEPSFEEYWECMLPRIRRLDPPFAKFLVDVRTDHTDLTCNNLGAINEDERPVRSVPATTVFHTAEHRTVSLIASAAEEQDMVDQNALQLRNKTLEAVFISDIYSAWTPKDDDPDVYGVSADGSITRYWAVIHVDDHIADLLPEIGDRCSFFPFVGIKKREMPASTLTANQITKIVRSVVRGCHAGERVAENVEENFRKQIEKAQTKKDNEDTINRLQKERPRKVLGAYVQHAGQVIYDLISGPTKDIADRFPQQPLKIQCAMTAEAEAIHLRQATDESDEEWSGRIHDWVKEYASHQTSAAPNSGLGPDWPAKRLPLPAGTQASIALFLVEVPRQSGWVPGLVKPFILHNLKSCRPLGNINTFLSELWTMPAESNNHGLAPRPKSDYPITKVKMFYEPRDKSVNAECDAVTNLNTGSDTASRSYAGKFWDYSDNFSKKPELRNLLNIFPGLAEGLANDTFRGEAADVVNSLRSVPFGWAFVTGGPGAGKTTAAVAIVKAITSHPTESAVKTEKTEKDDTWKAIEDAATINKNLGTDAPEANGFTLPEGDFTLPIYKLQTEGTGDEAGGTNADEGTGGTNADEDTGGTNADEDTGGTNADEGTGGTNADEDTGGTNADEGTAGTNAQGSDWLGGTDANADGGTANTNAWPGESNTNAWPGESNTNAWPGESNTNAWPGESNTNAWPGESNTNAQNMAWPGEQSGNDSQLYVWNDDNGSETVIEAWTVGETDPVITRATLETSIAPAEPTMAQASFLEQENDHTPVSGNRFEDPTAAENSDGYVVPSGLWDNGEDAQTTTAGRNARVAWTAPQNRLVDDATRRLQLACPDKKVVRVLPWPVEMKNLRRAEDTVPKRTDVSIVPNASPASRQMAGHVDAIRMTAYGEKSPSAVFNSFSEFARSMVKDNPTEWEDVERAWNEKLTDPTAYDVNRKTHEEAFQALVKAAAEAVDIVCSTPVTMVEFANKTTFAPDFIVVDEAARLSENLSVAVQAKWPSAPCLLIGDTKQFPPMALAKQQKGFHAIFANQREVSLFHRVEAMGRITHVMVWNHRAYLFAAQWAGDYYYGKSMKIANRTHTPATRAFMTWTQSVFKKRAQTMIVIPPDTYELKVGHSYANDVNAHYVTQMVVEMYRSETLMDARDAKLMGTDNENSVRRPSVLILTPYSVQKSAYDLLLRGMSVAEIPKDLVDVRTIDDSPSHEADIVIIDCVRDSRLGFIGNAHRMAVMMTRARVGTIIVGPGAKVLDNAAFADLREYITQHRSVIDFSKDKSSHWDLFCDNCIQPGHEASRCPKSPSCRTCNGATHSTRACPRASENAISIWMADKITANDGIERSIGSSVVTKSSGKRVKKNKSDRRQQFAKPGKTEDDNVFKKALREARRLNADDSDSAESDA